jgi:hypothetical protein
MHCCNKNGAEKCIKYLTLQKKDMAVYDPTYSPSGGLNFTPTASSPLYGGGFNQPLQGGFNQGNYYLGQPQSAPVSFEPSPSASASAPPQSQGGNPMGASPSSSNPLGAALGAVQLAGGIIGMKQLEKQAFPEYSATADLQKAKSRSGQFAQMGYSPEQRNTFMQDMARIGNEDYINAINMSGGNLSRALGARRSAMRFNALNQFAQGDAAQRMSNIRYDDSMTDKIQRLQDMNTQVKLNRRMALEQAYGGAIKSGTENIVNSFDSGQAMQMIAGMG